MLTAPALVPYLNFMLQFCPTNPVETELMAGGPGLAGFETRGPGAIHCPGVRCISDNSQVSKTAKPRAPGNPEMGTSARITCVMAILVRRAKPA
jgi:hypothetical protein